MNLADFAQRWAAMSTRDKRAVIASAVAVALLVIVYGVMPMIDDWSATRTRIESLHQQLASTSDKLDHWKAVRDKLRPIYGPAVDAPLPTTDEIRIHFVKTLQDALQAGGVQVDSIRPQGMRAVKEVDGVSLALYQVSAKCPAAQMPQCLNQLARAPRLILVDHLAASGTAGGGMFTMNLTVATPARGGEAP